MAVGFCLPMVRSTARAHLLVYDIQRNNRPAQERRKGRTMGGDQAGLVWSSLVRYTLFPCFRIVVG